MKKIKISHELIARFIEGNTTAMETEMILRYAQKSSQLRDHINFLNSISKETIDIPGQTTTAKVVPLGYVPMWSLAAQNKSFNQDLKTVGDCVVRCEYEIIKDYHPEVSLDSLMNQAKDEKWLQEDGTALYNIGRLSSEKYHLSVVRRYDCTIDVISMELYYDCKVIAVVNAEKLYGFDKTNNDPNHAVLVKQATDEHVILFDPQHQKEETYTPTQFIEAWKDSQCYMVSVIERGLRHYDPQPIDVSNFQLPNDIKDLKEAIAENSHDIWARKRMDEGWRYGEKRDDDLKLHPDLVPYSDLTDIEKEYDRITAIGILKLIQRLGYEIKKKE